MLKDEIAVRMSHFQRKRLAACIQKMVIRILAAFASISFSRTASQLYSRNQLII